MENGDRRIVAGEELPTGCFVRVNGGKAYIDPTLTGCGGIARWPRSAARREVIPLGEEIDLLREGGALARLTADVEISVRGRLVRFSRTDQPYLHLTGGRVTGFHGDERAC